MASCKLSTLQTGLKDSAQLFLGCVILSKLLKLHHLSFLLHKMGMLIVLISFLMKMTREKNMSKHLVPSIDKHSIIKGSIRHYNGHFN